MSLKPTGDFWDMDFKPKATPVQNTENPDTEAVLVCDFGTAPKKNDKKIKIPPETIDKSIICEYKPANPLLSSVSVWTWPTKYTFYEKFRSDALKIHSLKPKSEYPQTDFFSYVPQYSDMNSKQFGYYLWWRENVRNGKYLDASYSYVILYVYELINIPELIDPEKALNILCGLWLNYRRAYPHLDRRLTEWICDFCLINKLDPPFEQLRPVISEILNFSELKEFYIESNGESMPSEAIIRLCSNYHWDKCKDVTAENYDYCSKHIHGAVSHVFMNLRNSDNDLNFSSINSKIVRDAYNGSLCAYYVKKRIVIEYLSFSRNSSFRILVTEILKYAQNVIRASLGIKSRFTIKSIPTYIKNLIDEYFESKRKSGELYVRKKKSEASVCEASPYESLYEPLRSEFSEVYAKEVEKKAWDITSILADENDFVTDENVAVANNDDSNINQALLLLLGHDSDGFCEFAAGINSFPEALMEKINELAFDEYGDAAVEYDGVKYKIIDDYIEEINTWLNK